METPSIPRQNALLRFVDHQQTNIILTSLLFFLSLFIAYTTCLGVNPLDPYDAPNQNSTFTGNAVSELSQTTISLFFIVGAGLAVGRAFFYLNLPPLFGALLLGIAFKNISFLNEALFLNPFWEYCMRKLAFVLIMIRCGVAINLDAVRKSPSLVISLGAVSTLVEALAICLSAHFLFGFPLKLSIIFGFLLTATSPAVTVPCMVNLQNQKLGTDKGIPSLILASASIDNLVAIVGYTVAVGIIFSEDSTSTTLIRTAIGLVVSTVVAFGLGCLIWYLPRPNDTYTHLSRTLLLLSLSLALVFGSIALGCDFAGIICVMVMCITAAKSWKTDNEEKTHHEERALALMWNLVFLPLLFVLIGMKFDLDLLTIDGVLIGIAVLVIGVVVRMLVVLVFTMGPGLQFREKLIFVVAFMPKATVQAALAPAIVVLCSGKEEYEKWAWLILNACVIAILITAPLGQIILDTIGPRLLRQRRVSIVPEDTVGPAKMEYEENL